MIWRVYMLIKKFFFLMTTLCAFLITLSLGGINTKADYKNISPVYTTDSSGTYPTNNWHLTDHNQTDVINPQGGPGILMTTFYLKK